MATADTEFCWEIPEYFNMGVSVCDVWAERTPDNPAIVSYEDDFLSDDAVPGVTTFRQLQGLSNQMANLLVDHGFEGGDRVAIFLEQSPEVAITHIAVYKAGGIAVPLFYLFGEEAVTYRLKDSAASFVVTDSAKAALLVRLRDELPQLKHIIVVDEPNEPDESCISWTSIAARQSDRFVPVNTLAEDPALIIYTSGTTGQPKGALHAHRVLLGHLPGVEMSHNGFPHSGDIIWTPADWAWIGGLLDVLMPALYHGVPVVAHRFAKFEASAAFELIARAGIRNMFLPPTALRLLSRIDDAHVRWAMNVRSIASGGESLGTELQQFSQQTFNVQVNEFYGQTECNMVVSSCSALFDSKPGWIGKAAPGHKVAVINAEGSRLAAGEVGEIAVSAPDPVMLLEYWHRPEATAAKYMGDWLLTGDMGLMDAEGYIRFVGRDDDIITSAGYRIGPTEIEDCLNAHAAVFRSAVIGKADPLRTQIVKAFVIPSEGVEPSDELLLQLQQHVKTRLAAHEYPREIVFVSELPMTTTGKLIRNELRDAEI